ncbi:MULTISPECIES: hypothetical protein [unclassified Streptomyces]|uniref:hypothetical protein n=1 Tax=unclassified Streptomyces TaxID=2593676 RepID=UPI0011646716|nr:MULTISPECIES: hypothetical protein [unclassified Streptomyces]NMI57095.1 hypothetical protein [Streptomyces sp. RLA2-12]QDN56475.1 hypothetical protein FNV67_15275 [Streptomyces sp. S1D4-20]QDN66652.1 hypothetical protein FNV66_14870 [Streptomyces sp. S1D4-14]QDO49059.1 hypothetical protein FNV60_13120 [Streptomyces sp. RLB3-5]QDO59300.1 hypothetical protein FNV59_15365 [Streptomyces sp. RLB1-8]
MLSSHIEDTTTPGQAPALRRTVAFALGALGTEAVRRSTLRALLPKGETKLRGPVARERWHLGDRNGLGKNKTSVRFGQALQEFETQGWVERTPEVVIVRDRRALLSFALEQQPAVTADLLDIKGAIMAARTDLRRARDTAGREQLEQRHDEIRALLYLLHAPAAGPSAARFAARAAT